MDVLLAGDGVGAASLEAMLRERGLETYAHSAREAIADDLVSLERGIESERPRLAVGVGTTEAALALAITAPKLGVPFRAWLGSTESPERTDEQRILETLSPAESQPLTGDADAAAQQIAAWLADKPLDLDLESDL